MKMVSLTRSVVGLSPSTSLTGSLRPFHWPLMILTTPARPWGAGLLLGLLRLDFTLGIAFRRQKIKW
ncbi:hypothetical protein D3C85_1420030 [compost metagenome]